MVEADWPAVRAIYAAGIATGDATFEAEPPDWDEFDGSRLADLRFVAELQGRVVGWAAAGGVSDRCVYGGVAEHSVYVDPTESGRGTGRALLEHLIASSEATGVWTLQSGIFPENTPASPSTSVAASASSASASGSANTTAGGVTW